MDVLKTLSDEWVIPEGHDQIVGLIILLILLGVVITSVLVFLNVTSIADSMLRRLVG